MLRTVILSILNIVVLTSYLLTCDPEHSGTYFCVNLCHLVLSSHVKINEIKVGLSIGFEIKVNISISLVVN